MGTTMILSELLQDMARSRALVDDAVRLIDRQVAGKGGLSGMAVKGGYAAIKKVGPGVVPSVLGRLLPDFSPAMQEHYDKGVSSGNVDGYFRTNARTIANDLLKVTDQRAARAKNKVLKKVYSKLRKIALTHTTDGVPELSGLLKRHLVA
jgi:hypothetical protein